MSIKGTISKRIVMRVMDTVTAVMAIVYGGLTLAGVLPFAATGPAIGVCIGWLLRLLLI